MKLIESEKSRKATFQKRKNGIMKKAHELSTLCGVECCVIVYGPDNNRPEIWPKDHNSSEVFFIPSLIIFPFYELSKFQ